MATRFRKTKKVGATRFTLGKKSFGTSVGGKFAGVSMNSRTGLRFRASLPGTGISYSFGGHGSTKGGHSILWWLFIGWWWWAVKFTFLVMYWVLVWPLLQIYKLITKAPAKNASQPEAAASPADAAPVAAAPAISHDAEIAAFSAELDAIPRVPIEKGEPSCKWRNPDTMPGVHITNVTRQTNMTKFFPVVVVDTETTGIGAAGNRLVELSAIRLGPAFVPESCFTTLINPGRAIPASAAAVHHITDEMVADAPTFPEVAASFAEYISGCNIVGHNVKFDLEFLYAAGMDLPEKAKVYDTMDLAKKVLTSPYRRMKYDKEEGGMVEADEYDVENYKLITLCDYYGIFRDDAHRSLSDCLATAKVLRELVEAKISDK